MTGFGIRHALTHSMGARVLTFESPEARLRAQIRELTAKLKAVRAEIHRELRERTHRSVVALTEDHRRRRRWKP